MADLVDEEKSLSESDRLLPLKPLRQDFRLFVRSVS